MTGPLATAVAKKARTVRGEYQAGRAGTRYRRALAKTPATPRAVAIRPRTRFPAAAYATAAAEKPPNRATSRDSHERRKLRSAFHAWAGRPRWPIEASRATTPETAAITAPGPRRLGPIRACSATVAATVPTAS